jgi:hypothetical protein
MKQTPVFDWVGLFTSLAAFLTILATIVAALLSNGIIRQLITTVRTQSGGVTRSLNRALSTLQGTTQAIQGWQSVESTVNDVRRAQEELRTAQDESLFLLRRLQRDGEGEL